MNHLKIELNGSGFGVRTGNHIEKRVGSVNFSIVGRNATKADREMYKIWDENMNERVEICRRLNRICNRLSFVVGGETGIDIFLRGYDKAQIARNLHPFTFFGDRCEVGGNDHTLYLEADVAHWVKSWQNTYEILRSLNEEENQAL